MLDGIHRLIQDSQSISLWHVAGRGSREAELTVHEAFCTRPMRLALARVEMHLWTPLPPRRPESVAIKGVGTIS